jgi:hypothetical protein
MAADGQREQRDVVETVRPCALGIAGQHMVARNAVGISIVETEIPSRQQIAPLDPGTVVEAVCWRCQGIPSRSDKYVESEWIAETIAVVQKPHTDQAVALYIVGFYPCAEVTVLGHEPSGTHADVCSCCGRPRDARRRVRQVHVLLVRICTGLDKQLAVRYERLIVLAQRRDQGISKTTPAFVVTDESCQPCEVSAEHVAARIQVSANDDAFPGP